MEEPSGGDPGDHLGEPDVPDSGDPEPDQAWRALGLVNDWIKHADAKVGATLAASGAAAILLYNLVKDQDAPSAGLRLLATACAVAITGAGGCAGLALMPRLTIASRLEQWKSRRGARVAHPSNSPDALDTSADASLIEKNPPIDDPVNLLFFSNIAKQYHGDGPTYVEVFRSLTSDPERLTRQIAHQVHANATVAHRKFTWADRAIRFLVAALLLLGLVATAASNQEPADGSSWQPRLPHPAPSGRCAGTASDHVCDRAHQVPRGNDRHFKHGFDR